MQAQKSAATSSTRTEVKKIFNSPVDILNFFGKLGWSVSQNYFTPDSKEKDNILHFLLTKQVEHDEEVFVGLKIKK